MFPSILIVDDELSILQTLGGLLSDEGFEVATATNGYEALKVIDTESPDLVLLARSILSVERLFKGFVDQVEHDVTIGGEAVLIGTCPELTRHHVEVRARARRRRRSSPDAAWRP